MFFLKQSTAAQTMTVRLVDATDGYTPETGITAPTIAISLADAAFGAPNDGTWAELAYGVYTVQVDATDTATLGKIAVHVEKAGCRNFDDYGYVLPANIYDSWFGADKQQVDIAAVNGSADGAKSLERSAAIRGNKASQVIATGVITVRNWDDDADLYTVTLTDNGTTIARTFS